MSGIATEETFDQAFYRVTMNRSNEAESPKRLAYVFYVTSNDYACAALQFMHRLVNQVAMDTRRIDLVVLYTKHVRYGLIKKMKNKMHARAIRVEVIHAEASDPMWEDLLTKLRVFQDWGYERIVFLDSDAVPLTNLDHLFDLPSATLYAPTAYWLPQPFFASTLMVIEPTTTSSTS